jgi:hypothetical protein
VWEQEKRIQTTVRDSFSKMTLKVSPEETIKVGGSPHCCLLSDPAHLLLPCCSLASATHMARPLQQGPRGGINGNQQMVWKQSHTLSQQRAELLLWSQLPMVEAETHERQEANATSTLHSC